MDLTTTLITLVLFWAFVPGVLFTLPHKSREVVLVTHALLFALALHFAMLYPESFGNHGPAGCPPTHIPVRGHVDEQCVPNPGGFHSVLGVKTDSVSPNLR